MNNEEEEIESTVNDIEPAGENVPLGPPPLPVVEVSFARTIDTLLKRPLSLLQLLQHEDGGKVGRHLLVLSIGCLGIFGFILGLTSGDRQLWSAPLKIISGVAVSGLITLPSLYIFSCLNGLDVSLRSVAAVLGASLALVSLLLIGLAPVLWIFTQSTDSLVFLGFLSLFFWGGSLAFGLGLIFKGVNACGIKGGEYLKIWAAIFTLVTLQMSTALRPIIGEAETLLPQEKKFFVNHWMDELYDATPVE
jgi:hypothetical protein